MASKQKDKDKKKVDTSKRKLNIPKTWDRAKIVDKDLVGQLLEIYDGRKFIIIRIKPGMLGYRLGEFVFTRRFDVQHKRKTGK